MAEDVLITLDCTVMMWPAGGFIVTPITTMERELSKPTSILVIVGAALGATVVVSMKILDLWETWDAPGRGLAVMLLLTLLLNPVVAIWKQVSGKRVRFQDLFASGYMAVILATILFTRLSH